MTVIERKKRLKVFINAGLPYTLIGIVVVLGGIELLRYLFADSEYQTVILFTWLALFWAIYQPLFRNKILKIQKEMDRR